MRHLRLTLRLIGLLFAAVALAFGETPAQGQAPVGHSLFLPALANHTPWQAEPPLSSYVGRGLVDGDIYTIRADGSDITHLTATSEPEVAPEFSPTGELISFVRGTDVFVANLDGRDVRAVNPPHLAAIPPRWSPDGTRLFIGGSTSVWPPARALYVVRADGSGAPFQVSDNLAFNVYPEEPFGWSPDGNSIHYFRTTGTNYLDNELWVRPAVGGPAVRLGTRVLEVDWHPDSREIFFIEQSEPAVYVGRMATPDGNSNRILYEGPHTFAAWMQGGRTLLLEVRDSTGQLVSNLATLPREGGVIAPLTNDPEGVRFEAVSPNGHSVLYETTAYGSINTAHLHPLGGARAALYGLCPSCHIGSVTWAHDGSGILYVVTAAERLPYSTVVYSPVREGPGAPVILASESHQLAAEFFPYSSRWGVTQFTEYVPQGRPGAYVADAPAGNISGLSIPGGVFRYTDWLYLP